MDDTQIVVLEITSYIGISLGAQHYYGQLVGDVGDDRKQVDLFHILSQREAEKLNKAHSVNIFRAGYRHQGFDTRDEIIELALKTYKEHFPQAIVLILGRHAFAEPQEVLDGPEDFKTTVNAWFEEAERIGWYYGGWLQRMEKISNAFWAYKKNYQVEG